MLVLTRKVGEAVVIDGEITIKVSQIQGNRVKLCIEAPRSHRVVRAEIASDATPVVAKPAGRLEPAPMIVPAHAK